MKSCPKCNKSPNHQQVPAKRFPDLLEIIDNDPIINAFPITLKSIRDGGRHEHGAQLKVPERAWASTRMKEERAKVRLVLGDPL